MRGKVIGALIVALFTFGVFTTITTTVFADTAPVADDLNVDLSVETNESLYVIDKENYKQALDKDSALLEMRDHLLIVDSERLTQDESKVIRSYDKIYILGNAEGSLEKLTSRTNFEAGLLGEDRVLNAVEVASDNKDKDIIIAHSESFTDGFNAIQMGELEGKNVILINEEISDEVEVFLDVNAEGKEITFIEGDKSIDDDVKLEVLRLAGNDNYEIDEIVIVKEGYKIRDSNEDGSEEVDNEITDNSLIARINPGLKERAEAAVKENRDSFVRAEKTITLRLEDESEDELEDSEDDSEQRQLINDVVENNDLVTIYSNGDNDYELIDDRENNDEFSEYDVMITNNIPVDTDRIVELRDNDLAHYIVPKPIDENIIELVMDGEFGNGDEREESLTLAGYNHEEIQYEVDQIQEELDINRQELNTNREPESSDIRVVSYSERPQSSQASVRQASSSKQGDIDSFISELVKMEGLVYSQSKRMEAGYADCSSIILRAMLNAGVTDNSANLTTHTIASDSRFQEVPMSEIQRGDILWRPGHTEVYMGGNSTFGAFRPGRASGYASGINRFSKAYRINVN